MSVKFTSVVTVVHVAAKALSINAKLRDTFMKRSVLALAALALSTLAFAADAPAKKTNSDAPLPSTNCLFTFSGGTGTTFLKYCVTETGNILGIEAP